MKRIQWSKTIEENLNGDTRVVPIPENNVPLDKKYADVAEQLYAEFALHCVPYDVWKALRDIEPTQPIKLRSAVIEVMQTHSHYESVMLALKDTNHTHALFDSTECSSRSWASTPTSTTFPTPANYASR